MQALEAIMTKSDEKENTNKFIAAMEAKIANQGNDWRVWYDQEGDNTPGGSEMEQLGLLAAVENATIPSVWGTYDKATCTGYHFAVKLYNILTGNDLIL